VADYYTGFSEVIQNLTDEEKEWVEGIPTMCGCDDDIKALAKALEEYNIVSDAESLDNFPQFTSQIDHNGSWWISTWDEEGANLDHVAWLVQAFIKKFRPDFVFKLTWAEYCSKPRVGEFGGGWLVVSKDKIVYGSTWGEADETTEALRGNFKA
jgi:hypothetical protein